MGTVLKCTGALLTEWHCARRSSCQEEKVEDEHHREHEAAVMSDTVDDADKEYEGRRT
jgi:hypothetical protein